MPRAGTIPATGADSSSAYAPPGLVQAAYYEDAPLFASEVAPAYGHGIRHQGGIGAMFELMFKYLGDQWSVGDWQCMVAAAPAALPDWMAAFAPRGDEPPQNLKDYDPEWARAFWSALRRSAEITPACCVT